MQSGKDTPNVQPSPGYARRNTSTAEELNTDPPMFVVSLQDEASAQNMEDDEQQLTDAAQTRLEVPADGMRKSSSIGSFKRVLSTISNERRSDIYDEMEDMEPTGCLFGIRIRFTIMAIATLCLSSILSNILTFNFTYICMSGERPENYSNMTVEERSSYAYREDLDYDSFQRSSLFMAVAVGALVAVFPLTVALNKFGSRTVFGALGFLSAFATMLLPASTNLGYHYTLVIRMLQGVSFSACLPVMGSITSHWSAIDQNGIFIAILSSFLQIAPIFTMPVAGELCTHSLGWQSVYYLHGLVSIVIFTVFILYHRNSPVKHPMMRRKEIVRVTTGKGSIYSGPGLQKVSKKVPYKAVYQDKAIWAILVAAFGNFMGTQLSLQFMPTYINKVLERPIEETGMASAISPIIMFFIKLAAGQSSDRIRFISDVWKLRIYNTMAMGMMGFLFIVLALLNPHTQEQLCMVTLIASTCILGFNSGGFFKSSQMVSRQHSHFTLANIAFLNCLCMLFVPMLNELVAPENTPETWAIVLWIHGIILLATNVFFCVFASARAAPWTSSGDESKQKRKIKPGKVQPLEIVVNEA